MKKITEFSVEYPITVLMMVLGVILLGYLSFDRLGIDLFPDLNNPRLFVEIRSGEKPPEEIEKNYTDNIESLSIRQKDAVNVSSISKVGSAQITVEYSWDKDMDEAFLDLQKTLSSATQNWELDDLTITQYDPNSAPIMIVAFSHPTIKDMNSLRKTAVNYIRNELIRLEGIADIEISGEEIKEVNIFTNNYILEAHNLTVDVLRNQIERYNRNVSGGSIVELGKQYVIKGVSLYNSIEDFKNSIVKYEKIQETDSIRDAIVYLKDVAQIEFKNKDPENIVQLNGERCIGLSIFKETKYNTVQAIEDLEKAFINLEKALPGYNFTVIENQGRFIKSSIQEVEETSIIGIILAVLVIFIFLRRLGVTAIISTAIPVSIIATFNLMYFNELSLNIMTLGGLALGAGMLVDNAIVVMENIYRNIETGLTIKEAAIVGTSQVGSAITASTITTIIVFLPIVYLHGASGELFKDQAWTVAFSLFSSLFVAILVIPMLTVKYLKSGTSLQINKSITFSKYSRFLPFVLEKRWYVISISVLLIIISFLIIPLIGSEFMPKTDSKELTIELKLSEGTELQRTAATVNSIEKSIEETFGNSIELIYSQIGSLISLNSESDSFFEDENIATVKLLIKDENKKSIDNFIPILENLLIGIPELEFNLIRSETPLKQILGNEDAPIVIEVKGDDLEILEYLTQQIRADIEKLPELVNIESSFESGTPEIEVKIDRLRAGILNLSVDQITSQINDKLLGKEAGQWDYEGEMNNITIMLPEISLNELEDMTISGGAQIARLAEIADINIENTPKEIYRRNQSRIGKVTAEISSDIPLNHLVDRINETISGIMVPPDYSIQVAGEELKREESMANLTFALLLSIILVYMALASQFESLIHPFTILLTIPLAGVGAVLIFYILGMPFNIMAYIGIIMLTGIAVNDSIILVDAINQLKKEEFSLKDAIVKAGERRIRPIIMTSLTTILALLPLTIGFGEGVSLRAPMALAVIGGLVTSTILTLVVIPCVYYLLDTLRANFKLKI